MISVIFKSYYFFFFSISSFKICLGSRVHLKIQTMHPVARLSAFEVQSGDTLPSHSVLVFHDSTPIAKSWNEKSSPDSLPEGLPLPRRSNDHSSQLSPSLTSPQYQHQNKQNKQNKQKENTHHMKRPFDRTQVDQKNITPSLPSCADTVPPPPPPTPPNDAPLDKPATPRGPEDQVIRAAGQQLAAVCCVA